MIKITQFFGTNSRNAQGMRQDFNYYGTDRDIYVYKRPSDNKIRAWRHLKGLYQDNNGYHHVVIKGVTHTIQYQYDIRVCSASSHFFTTISSWIDVDTGVTYLIKETRVNRYMCEL